MFVGLPKRRSEDPWGRGVRAEWGEGGAEGGCDKRLPRPQAGLSTSTPSWVANL